jgi:hypothetical protein
LHRIGKELQSSGGINHVKGGGRRSSICCWMHNSALVLGEVKGEWMSTTTIFFRYDLVRWPHTSGGKEWPSKKQGAQGRDPRAPKEKN